MNSKDFIIVILIIICACLIANTETFSLSGAYDKSKDVARGATRGAKKYVKTVTFDIPQKVGSVAATIPGRGQRAMATGLYGAKDLDDRIVNLYRDAKDGGKEKLNWWDELLTGGSSSSDGDDSADDDNVGGGDF